MEEATMLTIHHLGKSQSERIVWLCEELDIPYRLVRHERDPVSRLAPPELRALHPAGSAPVITDGPLTLAESGAIVEYIIARHGGGRLALAPDHADYPAYLYWFHFANGNLQPAMMRDAILEWVNVPSDHPIAVLLKERLHRSLDLIEAALGRTPYLAGNDFTAADIMTVFSLTTMRIFHPVDLAPYPNILAYLQRIGARPAYRRAMQKGDPAMAPLLT
jgi:glutathione S-transferase